MIQKLLNSTPHNPTIYSSIHPSTTPFSMDQHAETTFLLEIEKRKSTISSKNNSRRARDQKNAAWTEIKNALLLKCGKDFDKEQLNKKWSNLQERVKSKLRQRNLTGGGISADLNTRDDITMRIIGETNPILNMVPGAWPAPTTPIASSTPIRPASSSGTAAATSSSAPASSSAPTSSSASTTTAVPTSPVLPAVDCASRKRKRTADPVAPLIPPPCFVGDPRTLTPEERAYYLNGARFYESARKYYDRMIEDIRRHDEQVVYSSFSEELEKDI